MRLQLQMAYLSNNRICKLPDNWNEAVQLRGLFIDGNPIGRCLLLLAAGCKLVPARRWRGHDVVPCAAGPAPRAPCLLQSGFVACLLVAGAKP